MKTFLSVLILICATAAMAASHTAINNGFLQSDLDANGFDILNLKSTSLLWTRATNGLGSAAFTASSAYDVSGAASAATNGLLSAAFRSASDFTNEVTRQINSGTNVIPQLGPALSDLSLGTNLTYKYTTNIVGAANWVFGKAYWTNITGNITAPALTMQDNAALETMVIFATNSGASTFTITFPGVSYGPSHVVPGVAYCTNATVTEIDVKHFGVLWTNAMSQ